MVKRISRKPPNSSRHQKLIRRRTSQPPSRQLWLRQWPSRRVFSNRPHNPKSNRNNRLSSQMVMLSNLFKPFNLFKMFNLFKVFKQMNWTTTPKICWR